MIEDSIIIDPEFHSMIPPLRPEERQQLEANLIAEGCRDPLVVWNQDRYCHQKILLDGHNRFEICEANDIPFETWVVELPDREAAADWIDANQLGRRNLTPDQYALLRGRRYNRLKKQTPNPQGRNQYNEVEDQNDLQPEKTAEKLGKQYGVSSPTIKRDGQFAKAVETVKQVDPAIEAKVVQGVAPARGLIVEAAKQIEKAEQETKKVASTPLLGSRKDREAATVWEKAKDQAQAILGGKLGTIAQAKREIIKTERREELVAKAAVALPSDAWEIIDGSCIDKLSTLAPRTARLVFVDPPYNIGWDYGEGGHDDRMSQWNYLDFCRKLIEASARVLTDDGSLWVLINHEWAARIELMLVEAGLTIADWITWYESFGVNCTDKFNRCSRRLFHAVKDPDCFVFNHEAVTRPSDRQLKYNDKRADPGGKIWDDVWGINPPIPRLTGTCKERLPDSSNQLPLALLTPIIGCASDPGDLVVDPCCGSGTTGEAAIRLGRRFLGIEKDPRYAGLSRTRLAATEVDTDEIPETSR